MPDDAKLPHLIALLDDESDMVREAIAREFAGYGQDLEQALDALDSPPDEAARNAVWDLLNAHRQLWLKTSWPAWYGLEEPFARLESALSLLAAFQDGPILQGQLAGLLDDLAAAFRHAHDAGDETALAHFLFVEKGLKGARQDYYHPRNSNLVRVIQNKRGLPISLACVYILVARRLGLDVAGCNWPGHFYAHIQVDGVLHLVDCYNDGNCIEGESFLKMQGPSREAARGVIERRATPELIVMRILHNLVRAYQQAGNWESGQIMAELIKDLQKHRKGLYHTRI